MVEKSLFKLDLLYEIALDCSSKAKKQKYKRLVSCETSTGIPNTDSKKFDFELEYQN